ncbi:DnaJ domain-containing protein [Phormidium sp. CLA17]|uniref:J domain-containing protein n=1 Tax=Leptolyngbya sp. Cla-17 TaxID=2803751 RepID=UPI001491FA1F|nr:J domain-containing protein [Leptolyngbya sp. Cla-17]MBM0740162.1 DnaJ domain-containing protein [Leptolyngbya sp. Cla-17]
MSQSSLIPEWTEKFIDPYAVLGVAVTADNNRVLKRYREIAKLLHPDRFGLEHGATKELATQLLASLVNPAYKQLKAEKGRNESIANLRIKVRLFHKRNGAIAPKSKVARQLLEHPVSAVDVFYEQAAANLATDQYQDIDQFESTTEQIGELNLVYLQLKMGDMGVREKRSGIIAAAEAKPITVTPTPVASEVITESYDQRHYRRARQYATNSNWTEVVCELRDAIKLKSDKSEYHSLLGVAYLRQNMQGMARAHLKRALELDPSDPLVIKYAPQAGIIVPASTPPSVNDKQAPARQAAAASQKRGGLFGFLRADK